jgi:hypothetical protein
MKDEVTVLGFRNLAETVPDRNLWSACDQHSQPDLPSVIEPQPRVVK